MKEQRIKAKLDEAHNHAFASSKQTPNRSDPFAYARIFSRVMNGVYGDKDLKAANFTLAL